MTDFEKVSIHQRRISHATLCPFVPCMIDVTPIGPCDHGIEPRVFCLARANGNIDHPLLIDPFDVAEAKAFSELASRMLILDADKRRYGRPVGTAARGRAPTGLRVAMR